jgi:ComF family protein
VAAVEFAGEVESWVHRFKYPAPGTAPSWVIPVPLHPIPLRRRGFNPAALIAREVARARGLPLATRALARLRDTPSQTGLDRRQRERNLAGAFACRLRVPQRVWLVDDVITTGSTLAAAARALRGAGAREITGLCIAWTPRMR